ncbi:ATP-binding protein [Clostridium sp. SHJSY1]|uniref:sensor histidine kinase n=1 Tax=Clostridium sp. SHJSY1 TaxID=2942483 RepID=UPI002876DA04|nr:ATP-binding protein [Clostridium sp. SHJSY1]MDS0526863.1 ATP-binding protein [Clostridium sp. SHJSY1]
MINDKKYKEGFLKKLGKKIYKNRIFNPIRKYLDLLKEKIEKSIRFEVMMVVAICFLISFIFYGFLNNMMKSDSKVPIISYDCQAVENSARSYVERIQKSDGNITLKNDEFFKELFYSVNYSDGIKAYLTDLDGNVLKKSSAAIEDKIDIFLLMSGVSNVNYNDNSGKSLKFVYPVNIGGDRCYFVYEEAPKSYIRYEYHESSNSFLALILSCIVFVVIFIIVTNKKMKYLDEISLGLKQIAGGNLDYLIKEKGNDEIRNIATNINYMSKEINKKMESERRSEKTKADLITNVSHDLRTPLTSIMGYIGLVKDGRYENEKTRDEYLDIAFNKAEKLKVLIEDLFEYTKLNNDGIKINKSRVNITEFLFQLIDELTPLFEENNLSIIKSIVDEKILVELDPDKMLRVFENLLTNAIKYSYKPGNIVIGVYEKDGYVTVSIGNKGANISSEKISKLFERFYRIDESRNEKSGGSGLGLAISKNIVNLHGGQIWAECYGEDISFYVKLECEKYYTN